MSTGREWLVEFQARYGRPLRVLHIGNIANNAYNNAKIQRKHGIEAEVSSQDYFHIMACPEWEDSEFEGDICDAFFPDWWKVETRGFRRPDWFAQGNIRTCQRYLLARRRGRRHATRLLGRVLTAERWLWCRSTPLARVLGYRGGLMGAARVGARVPRAAARLVGGLVDLLRGQGLHAAAHRSLPVRVGRLLRLDARDRTALGNHFGELFPARMPLGVNDLRGYRDQARGWRHVVSQYDVVQGYALDAILPLLADAHAWTAYEHGTLREIPFEDSPGGRICALAYRSAPTVFVTNSDVVSAARRLGLTDEQLVFLPHAVDSDRLFRFAADHEHLRRRNEQLTFFSPTRHDWLDDDPSWTKANDRLIRGFARLRANGIEARLVLVEWGRHLDASRGLIHELELTDSVAWVNPMSKTELWEQYLGAHAVADQFRLRAIGGVAFEAMALGCRVLTSIDEVETAAFFGSPPVVMSCSHPDEIAAAMHRVAEDPDDRAGFGAAARAWFERHHSAERIVELQLAAYERVLRDAR
jgi:glycosyltransferase involved in cell wall biosynthesis